MRLRQLNVFRRAGLVPWRYALCSEHESTYLDFEPSCPFQHCIRAWLNVSMPRTRLRQLHRSRAKSKPGHGMKRLHGIAPARLVRQSFLEGGGTKGPLSYEPHLNSTVNSGRSCEKVYRYSEPDQADILKRRSGPWGMMRKVPAEQQLPSGSQGIHGLVPTLVPLQVMAPE